MNCGGKVLAQKGREGGVILLSRSGHNSLFTWNGQCSCENVVHVLVVGLDESLMKSLQQLHRPCLGHFDTINWNS